MDYSGSPELLNASLFVVSSHNKYMFDEIELDIMNYQYQSMSYLPVLKAETDETQRLIIHDITISKPNSVIVYCTFF